MRILFWLGISVLIICIYDPLVRAEPGFDLGKTVLMSRWEEDGATQASISFNPAWEGDVLKLDLDGRLYITADEDEYDSLKLQLNFLENHNNPKFDLSYQWNEKYRLPSLGGTYRFEPLPNLKTVIKYETGYRHEAPGYMERYRFHFDQEELGLEYNFEPLRFEMDLIRIAKYYPNADYLSSEKLQLVESIGSKLGENIHWRLQYEEAIGDYPEDESLTRSYWKEYWRLLIESKKTTQWHWNCSYSQADWEQGIEGHPYRDGRRFSWELGSPHREQNQYSLKITLTELDYYSQLTYSDPDEPDTDDEDDDLASRLESRLTIGWSRHYKRFSLESELFWRSLDYKANGLAEEAFIGLTMGCQWEWEKFQLRLELAPDGSLQHYDGFYQLKLTYKP